MSFHHHPSVLHQLVVDRQERMRRVAGETRLRREYRQRRVRRRT